MREILEEALRSTFGYKAKLLEYKLITDGRTNKTVRVVTDVWDKALFVKIEKQIEIPRLHKYQIRKEIAALNLCKEKQIPVPKVMSYRLQEDQNSWLMEEFIEGDIISKFDLEADNKRVIDKEFEEIYNKISSITSESYGDTFEGGFIGKHKNWRSALIHITDLLLQDCQSLDVFGVGHRIVADACNKAISQIRDITQPVLFHCDLFSGNVMGRMGEDKKIHINAIIDFGMSMFVPKTYSKYITSKYSDFNLRLIPNATDDNVPLSEMIAYDILRLEPLILMKYFQYNDTDKAVAAYLTKCSEFIN